MASEAEVKKADGVSQTHTSRILRGEAYPDV